jgi:hypothetical protein
VITFIFIISYVAYYVICLRRQEAAFRVIDSSVVVDVDGGHNVS